MAELQATTDSFDALVFDSLPDMALLLDPEVPPGAAFREAEVSQLTATIQSSMQFMLDLLAGFSHRLKLIILTFSGWTEPFSCLLGPTFTSYTPYWKLMLLISSSSDEPKHSVWVRNSLRLRD